MNKAKIKEQLTELLEEKLIIIKHDIAQARDSMNADTKSSMGDKYETSRAMLQIQIGNSERQLGQTDRLKNFLKQITFDRQYTAVEPGALVISNQGIYLMAIALGKVMIQEREVMVISMGSPLGRSLAGKKAGDAFTFHNEDWKILDIH